MCESIANADVSEIEITPEMIEAGVDVLGMYRPSEDDTVEWVKEIYRAMAVLKIRRAS